MVLLNNCCSNERSVLQAKSSELVEKHLMLLDCKYTVHVTIATFLYLLEMWATYVQRHGPGVKCQATHWKAWYTWQQTLG